MSADEYKHNLEPSSALGIRELETIEKSIVELVETAGKAIMSLVSNKKRLSSEDNELLRSVEKLTRAQQEEEFKILAQKFFDLVDNIQERLRIQFRNMRNMGITSGDIPFFTVTYGEAKEYEIWINAARILRKELDNIVDIGLAAGEDMKMEVDEKEYIL
ncbi:12781_t:CDS:2 [Acaulospora colombiana]|uniref:12781_t:CDS:1 n=1 Tax=Acaulospora colombiana TaxID=27376 RepID=A0ACA9LYN3_9GLOM|nr:12781_t:CDS:2 [Acaulospora colombiana]